MKLFVDKCFNALFMVSGLNLSTQFIGEYIDELKRFG